jgi:chemotaxis protein CheX
MSGPSVTIEQQSWTMHLAESAREVFETMLGSSIELQGGAKPLYAGEVTAVVGLAGVLSGNFMVRCSQRGLQKMGECMLGGPVSQAEAIDAMGEVCNMLAGSWKRRITELADGCMFSVPTVVIGSSYQVHSPDSQNLMEQRFVFGDEPVSIQLQVQK